MQFPEHRIRGFVLQYFDFGKYKVTRPDNFVFWTSTFRTIRLEIEKSLSKSLILTPLFMDHEKLVNALVDAFQDERVIAALAGAMPEAPKKSSSSSSSSSSGDEAELAIINKHIIFATDEEDDDAEYMSAAEIKSSISEIIDEDLQVRPRIFNRLLQEQAPLVTGSRTKKYLVSFIVEDAEQFAKEEAELEDKKEPYADIEKPPVDVDLLQEAVEDYDDLADYEEHLRSKSKKALIKHINKHKMQVIVEDKDEDEIVDAILKFISPYLEDGPRAVEDLDVESEQDEDDKHERADEEMEEEAPKAKSKKKDKKKKKKKKKDVNLEEEDLQDLKKKDKKKKKKKKDK